MTKTTRGIVVLLLTATLTACSSAPEGAAPLQGGELVITEVRDRLDVVDAVYLSQTVVDSLPNQGFVLPDGSVVHESDAVVVGSVTAATVESAHTLDGERVRDLDDPSDPDAMWRLVKIKVEVARSWGVGDADEIEMRWPLSSSNSVEDSLKSLTSLGTVLLILKDGRVVHNEEYLGLVSEDGSVTYPLLHEPSAAEGAETVEEIWNALGQKPALIVADPTATG